MADKKNFFISTSIPYVNAAPHIGFALEAVQADIVARFHRSLGERVFFLSGTDDNALKNVQAAEAQGKQVAEYVAENARQFEELGQKLSISNDDFIKTSSDSRHFKGAQKLWSSCKPEDIYKKTYKGLYCLGCEEFKTEKDLVNSECPEHPGKKLEVVEEENYFFKLTNYQAKLLDLIENGVIQIIPETRKNETLAFIKGGLEDFSISRSKERARGWGVPVPEDHSQIMYVWFDALSNYITALGYGEENVKYKEFWEGEGDRVHVIGKGINRFHTIYWPAMLLSAGVPLPTKVFIHGYITVGGQKMSKSLGNVIDPNELIKEYGADATRYLLSGKVATFEDGDVTLERFKEAYNADLANGIGNLTSRIMQLSQMYVSEPFRFGDIVFDQTFSETLSCFEIDKAVGFVWSKVQEIDQKIAVTEPFKVVKTNPEEGVKIIKELVRDLAVIVPMLEIIMPSVGLKIKEAIKENKKPENLFPRKD